MAEGRAAVPAADAGPAAAAAATSEAHPEEDLSHTDTDTLSDGLNLHRSPAESVRPALPPGRSVGGVVPPEWYETGRHGQ